MEEEQKEESIYRTKGGWVEECCSSRFFFPGDCEGTGVHGEKRTGSQRGLAATTEDATKQTQRRKGAETQKGKNLENPNYSCVFASQR